MFGDAKDCMQDFYYDLSMATAPAPAPDEAIQSRIARVRALGYPTALMAVVSHLRQAMLDADYEHELQAYSAKNGGARPSYDPALKALYAAKMKAFPTFWEANTRDEIHRALDLAAEFGVTPILVGGREAAKVVDRLKAENVALILRVDFPEEPKIPTEAEFRKKEAEGRDVPLKVLADRAAKWKDRVATAAVLHNAGVRFALSSDGLAKTDTFHAQVRKLIAAGLPADTAVESLTKTASEIAGVSPQLGTIEKGKLGHLVLLTAAYGDEKSKPRYLLADGLKFDLEKGVSPATKKGGEGKGKGKGQSKSDKGDPEKTDAEKPAKDEEDQPTKDEAAKTKADNEKAKAEADKAAPARPDAPKGDKPVTDPAANRPPQAQDAPKADKAPEDKPTTPFVDVATEFDADRYPRLKTGGNVLIKDATVLTVAKDGTIARASILVKDGKIAAIGPDLAAPEGVVVIDATGLVAMPGIIDTHSHMAIQGGVNEMTLSIVPEVRVADVVDGDDPTIYNALAGGTTSARLLHGSANTIGGQDVVIKLRHGRPGRDLILKDDKRPQGVKFALGENVTRTRGPVPQHADGRRGHHRARLPRRPRLQGQAAKKAHDEAKAKGEAVAAVPPRPPAGGVGPHPRRVDQDPQPLLSKRRDPDAPPHRPSGTASASSRSSTSWKGYKVAAEIAAHGASASTFSDWWAYKVEAFDAIPGQRRPADRGRASRSASRATARSWSATSTSKPPRWSATAT